MKFLDKYKKKREPKNYDEKYIDELYETIKAGKIPTDKYFIDRATFPAIKKSIQLGLITKEMFRGICLNAQKVGNKL